MNMFARSFEASVLRGISEGEIKHKYQHTIKGFSAKLTKDTVDKVRYMVLAASVTMFLFVFVGVPPTRGNYSLGKILLQEIFAKSTL